MITSPRGCQIVLMAVAVGLSLLAGCGQTSTIQNTPAAAPADSRAAVLAWWTGGGQDRTAAMSKDFTDMGTAGTASDIAGLRVVCTSLQAHVESARSYASIPDTLAQTDWSTALAQAARAATDCIVSTRDLDADLLTQASNELHVATIAFDRCIDRLKVLRG
jgi:hypothetical protein